MSTLTDALAKAKTLVFVNYKGLTVAEANELRRKLTSEGVGYMVAKKTIIRRALDAAKYTGEVPAMTGETALAWSEDQLAPARGIQEFAKAHKEHMAIMGGVYENTFRDKAFMLSIASIPGRPVLLAQFVNLINSPIARLAIALNQVAGKKS